MGNRKFRDRLDVLADKPGDVPHEDPPPTTRCSSWGGLSLPYGVLGRVLATWNIIRPPRFGWPS